ncbi:MAG: hypothetical protein ACRC9R_00330 [Enterovibrio sp.]
MTPIVQIAVGVLLLSWPFVIWFGLANNSLHWLLPLMILTLVLRLCLISKNTGPMRFMIQCVTIAGLMLCVASTILKTHQLLLFYPVVVNVVMLSVFGGSLWTAMPLVERLARLRTPDLPPHAVRYTRRVTQVWCLFFVINGSIALFTALHGDMWMWTSWNGMISYLLIGALVAGEWVVRLQVMKRHTS